MNYFDSQQHPGVSFDISYDRKFVVKLCQEGLYAHRITDEISPNAQYIKQFKRKLPTYDGPFKDSIKCAPKSHYYAYTDRANVVVGKFAEAGFSAEEQTLDQMSKVNTIDWAHDENSILSGSDDDMAVLWDIETQEYISRFKGNSAASKITHVAMSKRNANVFATCHDRDIKIWDKRRTNPCQAYSGHSNRITHLDWSPHEDYFFLTCSLDKTVKLWNWKRPKTPVNEKRLGQKVWRALYDPLDFCHVFVALVVPDDKMNGVSPMVCEFQKDSNCDRYLAPRSDSLIVETRISSHIPNNSTLVGLCETGSFKSWVLECLPSQSRLSLNLSMTSPTEKLSGIELPTLSSSPSTAGLCSPDTTQNTEKFGINVQTVDKARVFASNKSSLKLKLDLSDPESPKFSFEDFPQSNEKRETYLKHFNGMLESNEYNNQDKLINCVCSDFRHLCAEVDEDISQASRRPKTNYDKNVPWPRTSGARFCGNNILIVFKRPANMTESVMNEPARQKTPRAYHEMQNTKISALTGKKRDKTPSTPSVSEYYYPTSTRTRQTRSHSEHNQRSYILPVTISDISLILPIKCRQLAERYCLDPGKDLHEICDINFKVAEQARREDLMQLWRVLKINTNIETAAYLYQKKEWNSYPYCRKLIDSYIEFYFIKKDVQTLAMIYGICALAEDKIRSEKKGEVRGFQFIPSGDMVFNNSNDMSISIEHQDSLSEPESDSTTSPNIKEESIFPFEKCGINGELIKLNYADVLYKWRLLDKRAEILKTVKHSGSKTMGYMTNELHIIPKNTVWECAICRLPVTNLASFCMECRHGGHYQHLKAWFTSKVGSELIRECPTGCGCICVDHMGNWDDNEWTT